MKVQNRELFGVAEPLQKLMGEKFPVMTSYKLAKLAQALNPQLKILDETRQALIRKYGVQKDGRFVVEEGSPNMAICVKEMDELLEQEVEVEFKDKIRLPEKVFCTCEKCAHCMDRPLELEPGTLMALDRFLEVGG